VSFVEQAPRGPTPISYPTSYFFLPPSSLAIADDTSTITAEMTPERGKRMTGVLWHPGSFVGRALPFADLVSKPGRQQSPAIRPQEETWWR